MEMEKLFSQSLVFAMNRDVSRGKELLVEEVKLESERKKEKSTTDAKNLQRAEIQKAKERQQARLNIRKKLQESNN